MLDPAPSEKNSPHDAGDKTIIFRPGEGPSSDGQVRSDGTDKSNTAKLHATCGSVVDASLSDSDRAFDGRVRVDLVTGSGQHEVRELVVMLRRRLRLSAAVLTAGFVVFLFRFLLIGWGNSDILRLVMFPAQAVSVCVLGALTTMLSMKRFDWTLRGLRIAEVLIFGLPALMFLIIQYRTLLHGESPANIRLPVGMWVPLIYTYALFIPNPPRRAIIAIGTMAAAPLLLIMLVHFFSSTVAETVHWEDIGTVALILLTTGITSVLGVDTIGNLRREAIEARHLGQYTLGRRLGGGGMGEVYLAEHELLKRPCAIKLIRPDRETEPGAVARFRREVQAMASLSHWNTVEIFDYGIADDGTFYYVMEFMPGMSLADLVDRYGPLNGPRTVHLLIQICDALAEAHQIGLIHRDIKPGNIFVARRGGIDDVAKLFDFGLVKSTFTELSADITIDGTITGTPWFMSPEQATDQMAPDERSDIYSLGAVAYFALTGQPPFMAEKMMQVLIAHARDPVTPPTERGAEISSALEEIVLRCLAKDPEARFASAYELQESLKHCPEADRWSRRQAARWWAEHVDAPSDAPLVDPALPATVPKLHTLDAESSDRDTPPDFPSSPEVQSAVVQVSSKRQASDQDS